MHNDQQACLQQIGELAQVAWVLRDRMLERGTISPEVVRLEEAVHLLESSIAQLASALGVDMPAGCAPSGISRRDT